MMLWIWSLAFGSELVPVHGGDTVAAILERHGVAESASTVRADNGLAPNEEPTVGTLLRLPDTDGMVAQRAFVLTLRGDATIDGASASRFDPVRPDQVVCTGADSFATVRLATQCTTGGERADDVTLSPGTCVRVLSAQGSPSRRSTALRVEKGSVMVQDNPDGEGHVTLQAGDAQTTGSHGGYRLTLEDDAARTEALYAMVAVQGAGEELQLEAGKGSRVERGQAPSAPVDLLLPGQPSRPDDGVALRRADFGWTPAPDAWGYLFEIATTPDFVDLVYQQEVGDAFHQPSLLLLPWPEDGTLYWRVATYDRLGFLGIPSAPRSMRLPTAPG